MSEKESYTMLWEKKARSESPLCHRACFVTLCQSQPLSVTSLTELLAEKENSLSQFVREEGGI